MNTILSYILSFVISTIIIVYIFNFPLLISNQPELVNEYYYQNAWYMIPFDFVIISLYFLSAYGISKLFKLKDDSDKILALILSVILISGTFYLIFINSPMTNSFFSRWFHKAGYSTVLYDIIFLTFMYSLFLKFNEISFSSWKMGFKALYGDRTHDHTLTSFQK